MNHTMKKIAAYSSVVIVCILLLGGYYMYVRSQAQGDAGAEYISIGQTTVLNGISIKLADIIGDSRCPAAVQCVWAGKLSARVLLDASSTGSTDLTVDSDSTIVFGSYVLGIESITPDRTSADQNIEKSQYQVKFSAFKK